MVKEIFIFSVFMTVIFSGCKKTVTTPPTLHGIVVQKGEERVELSTASKNLEYRSDTIVVNKKEIGRLVGSVDTPPELLTHEGPRYSIEMIEAQVSGRIEVSILVGYDGKARKFIMKNDLGHGTKQSVFEYVSMIHFSSPRDGGKRCSTWIETSITFLPPKL